MHFQPGSAYEEAGSVMYVSAVSYVAMFVRLAKEGEGEGEGKGEGEGRRVMVVRYPEGGSGFKVCLLYPSAAILCPLLLLSTGTVTNIGELTHTGRRCSSPNYQRPDRDEDRLHPPRLYFLLYRGPIIFGIRSGSSFRSDIARSRNAQTNHGCLARAARSRRIHGAALWHVCADNQ